MPRNSFPTAGVPLLGVPFLLLTAALAPAGDWKFGGPLYQPNYPDPLPPSYYGHPLDDPHPGYFGGARYREYYAYGRGYGWADYPGRVPCPYLFNPYPGSLKFNRPLHPQPAGPEVSPDDPALQPSDVARLEVRVPAQAEVLLDGSKTKQTGTTRTFVSSPMAPGQEYSYEVRARWTQGGREVEEARNVTLRAGSQVTVEFPAPARPATLPAPNPLSLEGEGEE
jgi:uncharacterized protein (TIGR03000 family)